MFCSRVSPTLMLWRAETKGDAFPFTWVAAGAFTAPLVETNRTSLFRRSPLGRLYRQTLGKGSLWRTQRYSGITRPSWTLLHRRYHRLEGAKTGASSPSAP